MSPLFQMHAIIIGLLSQAGPKLQQASSSNTAWPWHTAPWWGDLTTGCVCRCRGRSSWAAAIAVLSS